MRKKRFTHGYIFTLDAFIAVGVLLIGAIIILSYNPVTPWYRQSSKFVNDLLSLYTQTSLKDLNVNYTSELIKNGSISNPDNTIIEQLGEFYYTHNLTLARELVEQLTNNTIPGEYGIAFFINGTEIYERNQTLKQKSKILLTKKSNIIGIYNRSEAWGPYLAEVRVWQ